MMAAADSHSNWRSREYLEGTLTILHKAKTTATNHLSDAIELFNNTEEIRLNYVDDVNQACMDDYEFDIFISDTSDSDTGTNTDTKSTDGDIEPDNL